ncbi:MAG: hypothetical protein R3B60_00370 [Candidatus Paceibacterota bacterium]
MVPQTARAADVGDVTGFAWSSTIGWISSNCLDTSSCATSDYGIKVSFITGEISGQAWSENIGWISFNRDETGNPPQAPHNSGSGPIARYVDNGVGGGDLVGWARALAGCEMISGVPLTDCDSAIGNGSLAGDASGGWDGWISLSGIAGDGSSYGVSVSPFGEMSGWAWGGEVVGWISLSGTAGGSYYGFELITPDTSSIDLTASPTVVPSTPYGVDLTWTIANVTNCTASNNGGASWSGSKDDTDGDHTEVVTVNSVPITFTLNCFDNFNNPISDSVDITMSTPPTPSGTINASNCSILAGDSTCSSIVNWTSANVSSPQVFQESSQFSTDPNGSSNRAVIFGPNQFELKDGGSPIRIMFLNVSCAYGSSWNGTICEVPPPPPPTPTALSIDISANPKLIRSGRTAQINVEITSDVNLTCTLEGAQSYDINFSHIGSASVQSHFFDTRQLISTQVVNVSCTVDGNPAYSIPAVEARVNVIPITQET